MKVSEPAVAYNTSSLQGLKNRLIASIDNTTDEDKLQQCLELLYADDMPCAFTEEELDEVIRHSEASGNASKEDVKAFFSKWGH
ncbi:MAG: hypothetical protein LUE99_02455 [Bacteroides sp.]|nr:hypothetical protein [Bacteroides sp.]